MIFQILTWKIKKKSENSQNSLYPIFYHILKIKIKRFLHIPWPYRAVCYFEKRIQAISKTENLNFPKFAFLDVNVLFLLNSLSNFLVSLKAKISFISGRTRTIYRPLMTLWALPFIAKYFLSYSTRNTLPNVPFPSFLIGRKSSFLTEL